MSASTNFTCDICGKQKGEVNHWLLFVENRAASATLSGQADLFGLKLIIFPWNSLLAIREEVGHLCGAGCAAKKQQQWIEAEQQRWQSAEQKVAAQV